MTKPKSSELEKTKGKLGLVVKPYVPNYKNTKCVAEH